MRVRNVIYVTTLIQSICAVYEARQTSAGLSSPFKGGQITPAPRYSPPHPLVPRIFKARDNECNHELSFLLSYYCILYLGTMSLYKRVLFFISSIQSSLARYSETQYLYSGSVFSIPLPLSSLLSNHNTICQEYIIFIAYQCLSSDYAVRHRCSISYEQICITF